MASKCYVSSADYNAHFKGAKKPAKPAAKKK